jgi:hypothetical protein
MYSSPIKKKAKFCISVTICLFFGFLCASYLFPQVLYYKILKHGLPLWLLTCKSKTSAMKILKKLLFILGAQVTYVLHTPKKMPTD